MDDLLTTRQAADLAFRKPGTIAAWVTRGLLPVADRDRRGWPLFLARDVMAAERTARERDDTGRSTEALDMP